MIFWTHFYIWLICFYIRLTAAPGQERTHSRCQAVATQCVVVTSHTDG